MNSKRAFCFAVLLTAMIATSALGDTNQTTLSGSDHILKLHKGEVVLTSPAVQVLYSSALELLRSSSFNSSRFSARSGAIFHVQDDYRLTVSGKYLLVSFDKPEKITTNGGEVTVQEIVIGLNEDYRRGELFTIDDEGRVISHGKYSGPEMVKLAQIAKEIKN